jgi:hypothetical protein
VTCVLRTVPDKRAETLELILDRYADDEVTRVVASNFVSVWQRPLPFHLGQADLSFQCFQAIARWMKDRSPKEGEWRDCLARPST